VCGMRAGGTGVARHTAGTGTAGLTRAPAGRGKALACFGVACCVIRSSLFQTVVAASRGSTAAQSGNSKNIGHAQGHSHARPQFVRNHDWRVVLPSSAAAAGSFPSTQVLWLQRVVLLFSGSLLRALTPAERATRPHQRANGTNNRIGSPFTRYFTNWRMD
jgi:hypothetical protein